MTILAYKGYQASVDYEDGHLVIQLLHIDDFISTICDDARGVENAFHALVDEYLESCRQLGREPKKPYKGSLNVRMPPELHRRTAMAASLANVSLNAWIVIACQEKLASIEILGSEHDIPEYTALTAGSFAASTAVYSFVEGTRQMFVPGTNEAHDLVVLDMMRPLPGGFPYRDALTGRIQRSFPILAEVGVREGKSSH
jgi:predicted HicB family RNase H-like nuclease